MDVAGPDEGAVTLAASPGATHEIDDGVLARLTLAVEEGARVELWVDVANLQDWTVVVAVLLEVVGGVFRFGYV